MHDPNDVKLAVSALSIVSGLGLISVGQYVAERARRLEMSSRVIVAGINVALGGYALARGVTLQAGPIESFLLLLLSVLAVILFATRHGRRQIGADTWGVTTDSADLGMLTPRDDHGHNDAA